MSSLSAKITGIVIMALLFASMVEYSFHAVNRVFAQITIASGIPFAKYKLEECIQGVEDSSFQEAILDCQAAAQYLQQLSTMQRGQSMGRTLSSIQENVSAARGNQTGPPGPLSQLGPGAVDNQTGPPGPLSQIFLDSIITLRSGKSGILITSTSINLNLV
jgi:hypothetical protein